MTIEEQRSGADVATDREASMSRHPTADPYDSRGPSTGAANLESGSDTGEPAAVYFIGPGLVPASAALVAEQSTEGFAAAQTCVSIPDKRVIYQMNPDTKTKHVIGVLGSRHSGDGKFARAAAEELARRPQFLRFDDIVTIEDIAHRFRQSPATVRKWRERDPSFPSPMRLVGRAGVWDWSSVSLWAARNEKGGWRLR